MITRDELEALINAPAGPSVSLFMPTNRPSLAVRQDSIRLDNHLGEARRRLESLGWRDAEIDSLLAPVRALVGDDQFWANNTAGLAIFLTPTAPPRVWRLQQAVDELVVVGSRFHIAPLLALFEGDGTFYVLTVSANHARLLRGDRRTLREVVESGLPQGVDDTVRSHTDYEQTAGSNPGSAMRSGRGGNGGQPGSVPADQVRGPSPEDERKTELTHYLDKLASAFDRNWGDLRAPVVLAAQPEAGGHFLARSGARSVLPQMLQVNPDALDDAELHRRALAMVEPQLTAGIDAALAHFNSLYYDGSPRASLEPSEIVKAARWGKMDTLILAEGEHLWGRFDEVTDRVETHRQPDPQDDDLLDLAAQQTLLNGGEVRVVGRDQIPRGAMAAGIMRY